MMRFYRVNFIEKVDESQLPILSNTLEVVFNASAHLNPKKTTSYFTKLLQEPLNLKTQWEVTFSEMTNPSPNRKSLVKCVFFEKKIEVV